MSVRLLMPALSASAIEAALASVLARLSPQGEVAHEEDIGEHAVLDHLKSDGSRSAAPVYDYKMIDGDYLLAPVASAWLLHDERALPRAAAFLAAPVGGPAHAVRHAAPRCSRTCASCFRAPRRLRARPSASTSSD